MLQLYSGNKLNVVTKTKYRLIWKEQLEFQKCKMRLEQQGDGGGGGGGEVSLRCKTLSILYIFYCRQKDFSIINDIYGTVAI